MGLLQDFGLGSGQLKMVPTPFVVACPLRTGIQVFEQSVHYQTISGAVLYCLLFVVDQRRDRRLVDVFSKYWYNASLFCTASASFYVFYRTERYFADDS